MATGVNDGQLTNRQLVRLAASISGDNMESIAEGYLDISPETIKNLKAVNRHNSEAFNREILRTWISKNSENPRQVII